ncbi:MAG: sulfatase [Alistipes sp.]|jgi:arylsulfatase A-like enzyme|nr:sulfatase [Alistipes sp.]
MKLKHLTGLSLLAPSVAFAAQKPNIVFFIVDDMGWVDSSVAYGEQIYPNNMRYNTPNMQRLASQGVMLTNAYACPVSTPTRTSLLTGVNAAHSRITNWTSTVRDTPSDATGGAVAMMQSGANTDNSSRFIRPEWNLNGMSPVEGVENTLYATPLPQILKEAGYYTIHIGKAHWASAGTPGASPYNMGYVVNVSGNVAGMPRSYLSEENYGNTPEKWNLLAVQNMTEYYGTGIHLTEALTREALKSLDYPIMHHQPFYLYFAHYATHTPIQRDPRFVQKYLDAGMDEGQARYASMVEGVDKSLGDLLDFLEAKGVADDTIIIFMTDNGGNAENKAKGGVRFMHNLPLRNGKGSVYEGGVRVPLMVKWRGKVAPDTRVNTPVICEDLFPTILQMAGVKNYDVVQSVDGQSLVNLVTKGSKLAAKAAKRGEISDQKSANSFVVPQSVSGIDPNRALIFHYPHQWKPYDLEDIDYLSAVRKGDWKLVYRMRSGKLELYNLKTDIGEQRDLSSAHPELVKELAAELSSKLREWNSPMPRLRESAKSIPLPDEL